MVQLLNTWEFNVIAYLIFVVLFYQFYRLSLKTVTKDGAATILLQLIGGFSALLLLPLFEIKFPSNYIIYITLIAACIFYAINDRLNTTVRKNMEVSNFSIISQLSNVFLILIGFLIFREPFALSKVIGAIIVLFANFLLIYKKGKFNLDKYTLMAILAQFAFAVAISIDIGISKMFNLPFYIFVTLVLPAIMIYFTEKQKISEIVNEWKVGKKNYFLITGISWGLAILFMLRAYRFGSVTTVVPIAASSVLLNVIVAYIFLKERDDLLKKIIASALVMIGISITVFY
jgi:drug/metabolite transporter (DMT)-like permease